MVCVTLERLLMVSVRIVDFRFFAKFHKSGPATILRFELSQNMLVMYQKSSSSSKRPHQRGACYSGRIMDGF